MIQDMTSNLLFPVSFDNNFRYNISVVLDHVPKRNRISKFQQNIINSSDIDVFDVFRFHLIKYLLLVEFIVQSTITTRGQGNISLLLNHDLAFEIQCWQGSLGEESNVLRVIAKVFVLFKVLADLLVVDV